MKKEDRSENTSMPVWLHEALRHNEAVRRLDEEDGKLPLSSLIEEALVIAASYKNRPRPLLVVKQNLYGAQRLYDRISGFLSDDECALFSADESLRVESIATSPEMTAVKVETMSSLLLNPDQVVITCPSALLRHLPFPEDFRKGCIHLENGMEMDMEELSHALIAGGYEQTSHVDQPLTFARRGGIIDVYSITSEDPVRIEFFDTEIDSIRTFDITSQKTIETVQEADIVPASDVIFTDAQIREICGNVEKEYEDGMIPGDVESDLEAMKAHVFDRHMYPYFAFLKKSAGIWDYMDDPLIILSDKMNIEQSCRNILKDSTEYMQEMVQEEKLAPRYSVFFDYNRYAKGCRRIEEDPFLDNVSHITEVHLPNEPLEIKLRMLNDQKPKILALADKEMERVTDACIEYRIPYSLFNGEEPLPKGISLTLSTFTEGFSLDDEDITVITGKELLDISHHKGRYENKFQGAETIHSYEDLEPGDYVVHANYGVGQYLGIQTKTVKGVRRDFLKIAYKGNTELLVPLEQFRLVRKFVSREGVVPKLNKIGSGQWEKTKKKLQENVADIASRLIDLYANRETHIGHAFSPDTEMTQKFDNAFPYELTPDQKTAVEEIRKDMESSKPMDRLVCGDVGFGKTEVAVRASFKCVSDGMQTAVLCPTTILAEQHFHTFSKRYKDFPVTIRVLDRFVRESEVKQTLKGLSEGKVDIIIGTHRLLSKDVKFKNLGLLVIDEEQRFGVEHKERIKEMKQGIDVLTLSATPIPRTLQMSLVGIRQLSQLETPPRNRYSVQTYVVEKNRHLIIDAIEKELARDGQVFYLYNNIAEIYNIARTLQVELPDARIGVVHGQMGRDEIEDVMMRVNAHEIDVLVCTTIVENGIDIPNVNTILIDNAQDFGLAQIYQIKGRVGRSDRLAYAYLLIPPRKQLSDVAQKRLGAVKEFARLGSGYKIAMRDLTIRGAGDLLGASQSGFIDTVGIDMYIEMLEEAIRAKQTGKPMKDPFAETPNANIQRTSYIPSSFAPDDYDKLDMYQKIDAIETEEELDHYAEEIRDQYGRMPSEVRALFDKKRLDICLNDPAVSRYREVNGQSEITFSSLFSSQVDGVKMFEKFTKISKDITIRYTGNSIIALLPKMKNDMKMACEVITKAKESLRTE